MVLEMWPNALITRMIAAWIMMMSANTISVHVIPLWNISAFCCKRKGKLHFPSIVLNYFLQYYFDSLYQGRVSLSFVPVAGRTGGTFVSVNGTGRLGSLSSIAIWIISSSISSSISQVDEHPSLFLILSSSHCSPSSTVPLPHTASSSISQVDEHPSQLERSQSSHCSPLSNLPLPQVIELLLHHPHHPDDHQLLRSLVNVLVTVSLQSGSLFDATKFSV